MHQVQSYLGNPNVKRDGVIQEWTPDLVDEYSKCMKDPTYFAENYCKIISLDNTCLIYAIKKSCQIKSEIVSEDEKFIGKISLINLINKKGSNLMDYSQKKPLTIDPNSN